MSKKPDSKAPSKGTEFIFKLEGIELPQDVKDRIAGEIRATVMRELAKTDAAPRGGAKAITTGKFVAGSVTFIPIGWDGGWLIPRGPILRDLVNRLETIRFETRQAGG